MHRQVLITGYVVFPGNSAEFYGPRIAYRFDVYKDPSLFFQKSIPFMRRSIIQLQFTPSRFILQPAEMTLGLVVRENSN